MQSYKYTEKLAKVLERAKKEGKLKIGFLGGSITQGCNPSVPENAYVEQVTRWFKEKLKECEIEHINAGVGATGSLLGVHRVERDLLVYKPDLIFIEFAANDVPPKVDTHISYESLIRKILFELEDTAIIEIFMTIEDGTNAEEEEVKIAEYYQLPTVSYGKEIFEQIKKGIYTWQDIETDEVHPNDKGHGIVTRLVTELVEKALSCPIPPEYKLEIPPKPLFSDAYVTGKLLVCPEVKMIEEKGFEISKESFRTIKEGYVAKQDAKEVYFKCEIEAKNIFLLYVKGIERDRSKLEIRVNNEATLVLDTFFNEGWGNYPETLELACGEQIKKYTLELTMPKEDFSKKLNLLGFLVS